MRFAKAFAGLLPGMLFASLLTAQEELVPPAPPPNQDGLFDDDGLELEPLPESNIERNNDFPPPSFPSSGGSRSSGSKGTLKFADKIPNPREKLRMDFVNVEIEEVVKFFAERLKKKFIYDASILSGKITIVSPTEVTVEEAIQAFNSAMDIRGYVVYPQGSYLRIEKVSNARKSPVPLYLNSTPNDDSYVTRIVTLKFLNVRDIRQAVRDLVSRSGGDVIEHAPTNTLIISDYAANIRRIIRILNLLDVEGFQEQIAVVQLKYAAAGDVSRKISEIFPTGVVSATAVGGPAPAAPSGGSRRANGESVIQKVVSDDRTNSLIILGSDRGIEQVKKFIEQIDVPIQGGDGEIHIYPLQNAKAEDLSQTLAALASGKATSGSGGQNIPQLPNIPGLPQQPNMANKGPGTAALLEGNVKITADAKTNSLLIQASPRDYETLKAIIVQLDIRRRQVFIESVILEASVNNGAQFGAQVNAPIGRTSALGAAANSTDAAQKSTAFGGLGTLAKDGDSLLPLLSGLAGSTTLTGLALGFRSGATIGIPVPDGKGGSEVKKVPLLSAIVKLAATNGNLNVLSTPHILATANEEANIVIGESVPQATSELTPSTGGSSVTYKDVDVTTDLTITPQINTGDYLTLQIVQKVNELGDPIGNTTQFRKIKREAKTTAIVQDGQTIVIGGIMRDRNVKSVRKVPFLGDIPILGWLFKSKESSTQKVNLLLFITPHIIRDTADMNDVFFKKLREREGFLKGNGISEVKGVPISGYTPEQLKFLDDDYLKSLNLRQNDRKLLKFPEPTPSTSISPAAPVIPKEESGPGSSDKKSEGPNPIGLPTPLEGREELPAIPIRPRQMGEDTMDFRPPEEIEMGKPPPSASEPQLLTPPSDQMPRVPDLPEENITPKAPGKEGTIEKDSKFL